MERYYAALRDIRKEFPALLPVRVYLRDLSTTHSLAYTELVYDKKDKPHHFNIMLHKGNVHVLIHMLVHEWAHVISWVQGKFVEDHGPEWGLAISRIYQRVLER